MSRNRSARRPRPSCAEAALSAIPPPPRSAPAQKALSPAPVRTTARTASSSRARATAARRPCITTYDIAIRRTVPLNDTRASSAAVPISTSTDIKAESYSRTICVVLLYVIAVAVAFLIPAVTGGSYTRMLAVRWQFAYLLFLGLAIQIVLELWTIPKEHWHDWGFGLLVASYVLILAFVARNLVIRGMGIVFIGIACNALVITLNQGMPVKLPVEWQNKTWAQPTVKHHPQQPDDKLKFLSDIIVLDGPLQSVVSFGDLILLVGLCDVAYNVSRKPKRRGGKSPAGDEPNATVDDASDGTQPADAGEDRFVDISSPSQPPLSYARQDAVLNRARSTRSSASTTRSS